MTTGLAAVVLAAAAALAAKRDHCAVGAHTTLDVEVVHRPAQFGHDQTIGSDRLVMRALDGKTLFAKESEEGYWRCLGFDREKRHYLVAVYGETGSWLVLSPILYLAEDGTRLVESAFSRGNFLAMATLTSPTGRYVAFVGGVHAVDGLFVLDTVTDSVRRLGRPPAPPPVNDSDFTCPDEFAWGTCWADGYTTLDAAIWRFEGDDTLVVTRGKDTARRRARQRIEQRHKL